MTDLMLRLETVGDTHAIKVEAFGGTHIAKACEQATRIATGLGVVVHFDFNGVPCYARPGSDWRTLERRWEELFTAKDRPRFAMAWSDMPSETEGKTL